MARENSNRASKGASARRQKQQPIGMPKIAFPKVIMRVGLLMLILSGVGATAYFGYAALNMAAQRPIQAVAIEGNFQFVSKDEISTLLNPIIVDGFLKLPLMRVKAELEKHPWIAEVNVSRRWPDTLLVSITEQQAIARWGQTGFLNQHGNIVKVEQTVFLASLPWIDGDEENANYLMQQYQQFAQLLRPHGLVVTAFQENESSEMTVNLSNGLVINLGKDQVMDKFQRFLLVLQNSLKGRLDQIASVDLRYGNGLAVQWRVPDMEIEANSVAGRN